jgi:hypothetical protein
LFGSNFVSVHTPEQSVSELGQPPVPQLLFRHVPDVHAIPHPPQLSGSFAAFTHAPPPQLMSGAAHVHFAATQVVPPVQVIPQPPQLSASVCTSTHDPAQSASTPLQLVAHPLLSQTAPVGQALVHDPQCVGSFFVSKQTPPHAVSPVGQLHAELTQLKPGLHVRPQPPQFWGSVVASTHAPPQGTFPAGQVSTQPPALQILPAPQTIPQPPQFVGSVIVLVQTPAHTASPGSHAHVPARHVCALRQAAPHAPQFFSSAFVSMQAPPHGESPTPHVAAQVPALQSGVAPEQTVPHAPQFCGSLDRSTHLFAQSVVSAGHVHVPFEHC